MAVTQAPDLQRATLKHGRHKDNFTYMPRVSMAVRRTDSFGMLHANNMRSQEPFPLLHANMAATRTGSTVSCRIPIWPLLELFLLWLPQEPAT
jgi:hypothetical protein